MPYTLYCSTRSGSCIVEMALCEIGAPYDFHEVNLSKNRQREMDFTAVNPQRKLPALTFPTGETMTESAAIVLALDRRYPEAKLMPAADSADYLQAMRWLVFAAAEIYPIVEINDYPERFVADPKSDPDAMRENARRLWRDRWAIVEDNIAGSPYLLPSGFCLADIYIAVVSRWAQQDDWRPTHIPKVERLTAAVAAREACAPVWARNFG